MQRQGLATVFAALLVGCAATAARPSGEVYRALGQEPGWSLIVDTGRIDYVGDYGETRINVPRPEPRPTFNGHRYETDAIVVDITHGRCNDAMSGRGYADQVMVIVGEQSHRGCGGERRPDWDL